MKTNLRKEYKKKREEDKKRGLLITGNKRYYSCELEVTTKQGVYDIEIEVEEVLTLYKMIKEEELCQ